MNLRSVLLDRRCRKRSEMTSIADDRTDWDINASLIISLPQGKDFSTPGNAVKGEDRRDLDGVNMIYTQQLKDNKIRETTT